MELTEISMKEFTGYQQGELDGVAMYQALAKTVKEKKDAEIFLKLAADEGRHASVFRKYTGKTLKPDKTKAVIVSLLYKLLGRKRLYPLIAKGEYAAIDGYDRLIPDYPEVESVRDDEKRHGDTVLSLLENGEAEKDNSKLYLCVSIITGIAVFFLIDFLFRSSDN